MIKLFRLFPFLLMISLMCLYPMTTVLADGENDKVDKELDISLSVTDSIFDISNMKPGDWAPRTIAVQNSGKAEFVYQMNLENLGNEKLFNELVLEIKSGDTNLYQGKMVEFKSFPERKLLSSTEENLDITIRFPEHLGNEFQGLESAFAFSFTAEGRDNTTVQAMTKGQVASVGPTASGDNHETSPMMFNLLLFGTILVFGAIVWMIIRHFRRMKITP